MPIVRGRGKHGSDGIPVVGGRRGEEVPRVYGLSHSCRVREELTVLVVGPEVAAGW